MLRFFVFIFFTSVLISNPSGERVTHGKVEITRKGNQLSILQKGSKSIVEWDQFSIDQNEITEFIQPSCKAALLNRVNGGDPSQILGTLKSNGSIYLLNKQGILVGKDAVIDVGSFVASTLELSDQKFLEGKELPFSGESLSSIVNLGKICAEHDIYLFALNVENQGEIISEKGTVGIGGGEILLQQAGKERVFVSLEKEGSVSNTGMIDAAQVELKACGGNLHSLAVNHEGYIHASCIEERNGNVYLQAEQGKTRVSGEIVSEGDVHLLGSTVLVGKQALIDVSKSGKAGEILIGGDYQGSNPEIPNAKWTFVGRDVQLKSNGLGEGDAGKIIIWGDTRAIFHGYAEAKGGDISGDGGFIEVSSPSLVYKGSVSTDAINGAVGTLLLDPTDITIINGLAGGSTPSFPTGMTMGGDDLYEPASTATLTDGDIIAGLASSAVVISTAGAGGNQGTISMGTNVNITWATDNELTMIADKSIRIFSTAASITNTSSTTGPIPVINLQANVAGGATGSSEGILNQGTITTVGRSIRLVGRGATGTSQSYGIQMNSGDILTQSGSITLSGTGGGDGTGTGTGTSGILITFGSVTSTGASAGDVILRGVGGNSSLNSGVSLSSTNAVTTNGANIFIIGKGSTAAGIASTIGITLNQGVLSTNTGNIGISGYGGRGGAQNGLGVSIINGASVLTDTGNISIEGRGATLGSSGINPGVFIGGSSTTSVSTTSGTINIDGIGGSVGSMNNGVEISSRGVVSSTGSSPVGKITINGMGGVSFFSHGVLVSNNGRVTSVGGDIGISGTATSTSSGIYGVGLTGTGVVQTTGGKIGITGAVAGSGNANYGILLQRPIQTTRGVVSLSGTGGGNGSGSQNFGVFIDGGSIGSTGSLAGAIALVGVGGSGTSSGMGVAFDSTGSITTKDANVSIIGKGSTAPTATSLNVGVYFVNGSFISTESGTIGISGFGGKGSVSGMGYGVYLASGSYIESTGTSSPGSIMITGIGGTGANNNCGVYILSNQSLVSSESGAINISGEGGAGSGASNVGVTVDTSAKVISKGSTGASISIIGKGGSGTNSNFGVLVNAVDSNIGSTGANINITATGNGGTDTNYGLSLNVGSVDSVSGNIVIRAKGGSGSTGNSNQGVNITGGSINNVTGSTSITGMGGVFSKSLNHGISISSSGVIDGGAGILAVEGIAGGTGDTNRGISIESGGKITTTAGSGVSVLIDGMGGPGIDGNEGIHIEGAGSEISTTDAMLSITGTGGGVGVTGTGVYVGDQGRIVTKGSGSLVINATAGAGTSVGVLIGPGGTTGGQIVSTGAAEIRITADSSLGDDMQILANGYLGKGATSSVPSGNIELYIDDMTIDSSANIQSTGDLSFLTSPGVSMELGGAGPATATLGLTGGELSAIKDGFNLITFGQSTSIGDAELKAFSWSDPLVVNGKNITVSAGVTGVTGVGITLNIGRSGTTGTFTLDSVVTNTSGTLTVNGGSQSDTFDINVLGQDATFNGASGTENTLFGPAGATMWSINSNNGGVLIGSTMIFSNMQNLVGTASDDIFTFTGPYQVSGGTGIAGAAGTNTIIGPPEETNWVITAANEGTLEPTGSSGPTKFSSIQTLIGGAGEDIFDVSAGFTTTNPLDGGGGVNTIIGPNTPNAWTISSDDTGDINGSISFTNMGNLSGGSDTDDFTVADGVVVTGTIDGNGEINSLDLTAYTSSVSVSFGAQATSADFRVNNIDDLMGPVGGGIENTLYGPNQTSLWILIGTDAGTLEFLPQTTSFSDFSNVVGGSRNDRFNIKLGTVTGIVDGGNGGTNRLIPPDVPNTWNITEDNKGTVAGVSFKRINYLSGGDDNDTFTFSNGVGVSNVVNGGGGFNDMVYPYWDPPAVIDFITPTSGTASNIGIGFINIQKIGGVTVMADNIIFANVAPLNLAIREVDNYLYTDRYIPIRYSNMFSPITGVFMPYNILWIETLRKMRRDDL